MPPLPPCASPPQEQRAAFNAAMATQADETNDRWAAYGRGLHLEALGLCGHACEALSMAAHDLAGLEDVESVLARCREQCRAFLRAEVGLYIEVL